MSAEPAVLTALRNCTRLLSVVANSGRGHADTWQHMKDDTGLEPYEVLDAARTAITQAEGREA